MSGSAGVAVDNVAAQDTIDHYREFAGRSGDCLGLAEQPSQVSLGYPPPRSGSRT
ncbi:MAG: hypothetical protein JO166_19725 [Deltaproteobacteria bacterium]|nr:hypothetical protein [Deltaproteobacteria bacterium]